MSSLPIQIVDENDKPIGGADMKKAWLEGLYHRVARIMVQDDEGSLLLQLRVKAKELWPERWDNSAAGHVDLGESYEDAAARELKEEVGIADVKLQSLDYYFSDDRYKNYRTREFNKVYLAVIPKGYKTKRQESEVADIRWFSKEEVRELLKNDGKMTPGLKNVLTRNPFLYEDN